MRLVSAFVRLSRSYSGAPLTPSQVLWLFLFSPCHFMLFSQDLCNDDRHFLMISWSAPNPFLYTAVLPSDTMLLWWVCWSSAAFWPWDRLAVPPFSSCYCFSLPASPFHNCRWFWQILSKSRSSDYLISCCFGSKDCCHLVCSESFAHFFADSEGIFSSCSGGVG